MLHLSISEYKTKVTLQVFKREQNIMLHLSRGHRKHFSVYILLIPAILSMLFSPSAAFAKTLSKQATMHVSAQRSQLFLFVQGVDTSLSENAALNGTITSNETFGLPNGPYPFLKASYPHAHFLMFSYNGDNGSGIPTAYACQDTLADKASGYAPSNTLKSYAMRLNIQLQHYLAGKPATDVYLVSHSLGGIVVFSYLAYLKSISALGTTIPGTNSRVKGVITLDSPIGGLGGGLPYAQEVLNSFAAAGFPCAFLQQHHIILSTAKQVVAVYQQTLPPLGGTNSIMNGVFGSPIANQKLAEDAAKGGIAVLTVGNERDYLFGPQACHSSVPNFLSSQWIQDEGNTSGVYGRSFVSGAEICRSLDMNHRLVLTDATVHQAMQQFIEGRAVTTLNPS